MPTPSIDRTQRRPPPTYGDEQRPRPVGEQHRQGALVDVGRHSPVMPVHVGPNGGAQRRGEPGEHPIGGGAEATQPGQDGTEQHRRAWIGCDEALEGGCGLEVALAAPRVERWARAPGQKVTLARCCGPRRGELVQRSRLRRLLQQCRDGEHQLARACGHRSRQWDGDVPPPFDVTTQPS